MTKIELYDLIKKESEKKSRPLKVISDWDECLFPFNPLVLYKTIQKEIKGKNEDDLGEFPDFFKSFHENHEIDMAYDEKFPYARYKRIAEEYIWKNKQIAKLQEKLGGTIGLREKFKSIRTQPDFYEKAPYLSTAQDLLKCLKEGLIEKLVIVSSSIDNDNSRKRKKLNKGFGKFPQASLELHSFTTTKKPRWQWAKESHPDFDIFIDDNSCIIKECVKNLPSDKIYLLADYACNRQTGNENNVFLFPISVSSLKDSDFKYKQKQDSINSINDIKSNNAIYWMIGTVSVILIIGFIIAYLYKKKKLSQS